MQIRRFHCEEIGPVNAQVTLDEGESLHALRVLRLEAGDRLQLLDGRGTVAEAELSPPPNGVNPRKVRVASCRIIERREAPPPAMALALYVAPPRGKAFETVLREAVELGVAEIHPVLCEYGVARPEEASDGWQATLLAAMKQSANPWLPRLFAPLPLAEALSARLQGAVGLFGASPGAEAHRLTASGHGDVATQPAASEPAAIHELWVGPEGGFSPAEEGLLLAHGLRPVTLATCILRVETAVPALAGYLLGSLRHG